MFELFTIASIWLALAVISTIFANRLKISMALMKIMVGAVAGYICTRYFYADILHPNSEWLKFVAGAGAVLLTFLAGAELDPSSLREKAKEVSVVGMIGFLHRFSVVARLHIMFLDGTCVQGRQVLRSDQFQRFMDSQMA
ncbi:MAG: cation:proton antiporter [Spirochaetes bacterium]|nr:cation:proton antiporter [Spirochaetota bacterium]